MNRLSQDVVECAPNKPRPGKQTLNRTEEAIFLRLPTVKSLTGLSKSSLYGLIRANNFPAPIQIGPRTVAWVSSEVKEWAAERISRSRSLLQEPDVRRNPQRAVPQSWASPKKWA